MSPILFTALHCLLSASGVCYALEIQYHHVASGGLKTCGICSVLYVCVSSCNLSPRSDYNRFVLLGLYRHLSIFPSPAPGRSYALYDVLTNFKIELHSANIVQICVFTFGIITLLWFSYLHLCNRVRYVCFSHNLSILAKKNNPISSNKFPPLLPLLLLGLLLELEKYQILFFIIRRNPNFGSLIYLLHKFSKTTSRPIFNALSFYIFNALSFYISSISVTPFACIVGLVVFQIWTYSIEKCVPFWLPMLLSLISNDIHLNPGPPSHLQNNFFNFMTIFTEFILLKHTSLIMT